MAPNFGVTLRARARSFPKKLLTGLYEIIKINRIKHNHREGINQRFKMVKRKYEKTVAG